MPRRSIDWEAELAAWLKAKTENPLMTAGEFFKERGLNSDVAYRKIGKKMTESWSAVQVKARSKVEKDTAINLAKEMQRIFRVSRKAFSEGAKKLLSGKPGSYEAKSFAEALALLNQGQRGMLDVTNTLTGGEPVMPPKPVEGVFEWVEEPEQPKSKRGKTK